MKVSLQITCYTDDTNFFGSKYFKGDRLEVFLILFSYIRTYIYIHEYLFLVVFRIKIHKLKMENKKIKIIQPPLQYLIENYRPY